LPISELRQETLAWPFSTIQRRMKRCWIFGNEP